MLPVVEIFYSLQGEGPYRGRPSVFVRLGGCNLSCEGFRVHYTRPNGEKKVGCDSWHSVDRAFEERWANIRSVEELEAGIKRSVGEVLDYDIVITGGEPTLFAKNPILYDLIKRHSHRRITFETNGTITIDFDQFPLYRDVVFAISLKLSNSGEPASKRIQPKALNAYLTSGAECFLKCVVSKDALQKSTEEIEAVLSNYPFTLYLMPLGETDSMLCVNAKPVFELCVKKGWNYSDRIHIRIYGSKGGV